MNDCHRTISVGIPYQLATTKKNELKIIMVSGKSYFWSIHYSHKILREINFLPSIFAEVLLFSLESTMEYLPSKTFYKLSVALDCT